MIIVGCNRKHVTASNLLKVPEFVVNLPSEDLVSMIYNMPWVPSPRSLERVGLTPLPSLAVVPPSIAECYAHLECRLVKIEGVGTGEEIAIFGEVIRARINSDARQGSYINRYSNLRPVFFLEDGTYGVIDLARTIGQDFTDMSCVVVTLSDVGDVSKNLSEHIAYLKRLQKEGRLVASGSFPGDGSGGMYVLRTNSLEEASDIVSGDPLVMNKICTFSLHVWRRSF
jgi:flavin reductase (DIM6/NTAB) family NADH-FMN oxidoreductase RutF/uncharacterized protein YciI